FIEALRRYASAGNTRRATLLDSEPNGERAATLLLEDAAHAYTNCDSARGCLLVAQAASQASRSPAICAALGAAMAEGNAVLRERLQRAVREGDIAPDADVDAMTAFFAAVMAGLSVMAMNGADSEQLNTVVQTAMRAWPRAAQSPLV
ncbi:MAG TPA: TetR/AcrR family transcriptional regulator C-terminal ligand-binding domain-containing protein, partial [Gemmatimonas sp.]|nr:TetR/AcrR family transcriptional regulator C-terminal ligand-binding domain-containing protein [Gemmatimonas sp.]